MRRTPVALLAALALLAPLVAPGAGGQPAGERHAVRLSVLEWHPYPDPEAAARLGGDPFGVPFAADAAQDRMAAYYGATWFPTARFDGVIESSYEKDGILSDLETFHRTYRGAVERRLAEDSPLVMTLEARGNATLTASLRFVPKVDVDSDRLAVRLVLFEDDVTFDGGNGVLVHRFLVRHAFEPAFVGPLVAGSAVEIERNVTRPDPARKYPDANWGPRLGVVAFVQNEDARSPNWEPMEVLQSATAFTDQEGPTVQASKAVLLELYTATWCASCVMGDGATDLVADEYGVASARPPEARRAYFDAPEPWRWAAAAAAAGVLGVALWPRRKA